MKQRQINNRQEFPDHIRYGLDGRSWVCIHRNCLWRFSNNSSSNEFSDAIWNDEIERQFVRGLMENKKILRQMDKLDGGTKSDRFGKLKEKILSSSVNSKKRRDIHYALQVLFSLYFRNDTGRKGSLSTTDLLNQPDKENEVSDIYNLTVNLSEVKFEGLPDKTKKLQSMLAQVEELIENDSFKFNVDLRDRMRLKKSEIEKIEEIFAITSCQIANRVKDRGHAHVVPYSIDFFVGDGHVKILEMHCPPRGMDMMYLPFSVISNNKSTPGEILQTKISNLVKAEFNKARLNSICVYYPKRGSTFINRDVQVAVKRLQSLHSGAKIHVVGSDFNSLYITEDEYYAINTEEGEVYPDLIYFCDVPEGFEGYRTNDKQFIVPSSDDVSLFKVIRNCSELETFFLQSCYFKKGDEVNMKDLRNRVGDQVVMKQGNHKAWWSTNKKKCRYFDLRNKTHQKLVKDWIKSGSALVEELVNYSNDRFGHHGELRVFGFVGVSPDLDQKNEQRS